MLALLARRYAPSSTVRMVLLVHSRSRSRLVVGYARRDRIGGADCSRRLSVDHPASETARYLLVEPSGLGGGQPAPYRLCLPPELKPAFHPLQTWEASLG